MALCAKSLKKLMMHKWAGPFLHPVDPVALGLSDYFDVVKHPMDFSTILSQIENHELRSKDEFASKVNLVFDNALLYNSKGSDVHIMASELQSLFAKEMETITGQIFAAGPDAQAPTYYVPSRRERAPLPDIPPKLPRVSESRPAKSSAEKARLAQKEEMEMMKSRIQQLEGELSRMTQEVNERQGKGEKALDARPMTMEEKKALSMEINQLKGSDLEEVVRIVWGQMAGEQMQQNDIELDLSAMPNETLRKLERYIVQCKEAKKAPKRQRKAHLHTPREKTFDFDDNQFVDDFEDSLDSVQEEY
ncbi:uncharacterized protein [Blastocystis hominis]|uniref:Bromo domain-containing protein n=1 Tax=Blastocystis hominis TaxID=12968 RepID=D8M0W5_BLAHO|nr:uncharacterized protein [Blastocystis hominis]CBK21704.2 unnamed protein product [Blastocystis hominis]|eukprot:XP_012895752.1 uncharacterized protein [Blastocystis hominis]